MYVPSTVRDRSCNQEQGRSQAVPGRIYILGRETHTQVVVNSVKETKELNQERTTLDRVVREASEEMVLRLRGLPRDTTRGPAFSLQMHVQPKNQLLLL